MTQQQKIYNHLKRRPITGLDAWKEHRIYRLSEMISRIRKEGHRIETKFVEIEGVRFAKYSLKKS